MAVSESDEPPWAVVDAGVSKNVLFQSVPFLKDRRAPGDRKRHSEACGCTDQ